MEQYINFALHHWFLASAFLLTAFLLLIIEVSNKMKGANAISPHQATRLINHENALLLDIRQPDRFSQGHILGSLNIPSTEVEKQEAKLRDYKNQPIIVICETGQTASAITALLKKQGFAKVGLLKGGLKAWKESQLPIIKK